MNYLLEEYYSLQPQQQHNKRKDQLALTYNRALFQQLNNQPDEATNILLKSISHISSSIDEEKSRLGFMEVEGVMLERKALRNI